MPAIVVRNISAETHRALRVRARQHGRSTEAEIRAILDVAVRPTSRMRLGSALAALAKPFGD
jgi:antitoxin FitA